MTIHEKLDKILAHGITTEIRTEMFNRNSGTKINEITLTDLPIGNTILLILTSSWSSGKNLSTMQSDCYCTDSKVHHISDSYTYLSSGYSSCINRIYKFKATESTMTISEISGDANIQVII